MSGRLIITNKKSYTPWNAKNVERALRDERIHREEEEKRQTTARQERNAERISWMKKQQTYGKSNESQSISQGVNDDGVQRSNESTELRHVNLFEEEEKRCLDAAINSTDEMQRTLNRGIMPVYLVETRREERVDDLFYKRKDILRKDVDDKVKQRQDPMTAYHTAEKVHQDKCRRIEKSTSRDFPRLKNASIPDSFSVSNGSMRKQEIVKEQRKRGREEQQSTRRLVELRQRRLKREGLESAREKDCTS